MTVVCNNAICMCMRAHIGVRTHTQARWEKQKRWRPRSCCSDDDDRSVLRWRRRRWLWVTVTTMTTALCCGDDDDDGSELQWRRWRPLCVAVTTTTMALSYSDDDDDRSVLRWRRRWWLCVAVLYLTTTMGLGTVSVCLTVFILSLHHRDSSRPVPRWARLLVLRYLSSLLCVRSRRPPHRHRSRVERDWRLSSGALPPPPSAELGCLRGLSVGRAADGKPYALPNGRRHSDEAPPDSDSETQPEAERAAAAAAGSGSRWREKRERRACAERSDWKEMANVLDRLFFWLVLFMMTGAVCAVFFVPYFAASEKETPTAWRHTDRWRHDGRAPAGRDVVVACPIFVTSYLWPFLCACADAESRIWRNTKCLFGDFSLYYLLYFDAILSSSDLVLYIIVRVCVCVQIVLRYSEILQHKSIIWRWVGYDSAK